MGKADGGDLVDHPRLIDMELLLSLVVFWILAENLWGLVFGGDPE